MQGILEVEKTQTINEKPVDLVVMTECGEYKFAAKK